MLRFLRRYSKYILVVFGSLLLITFLIPFAFTQLLQGLGRGRSVWAEVGDDGQKIRASQLWDIQRELQVVQFLNSPLPEEVDTAEYWYLLTREAADAGLIGSPYTLQSQGLDDNQLAILAARSGGSVPFVRQTIAKWEGVSRLLGLYLDGDKYSDRRLRNNAQRAYHQVTVRPVVIAADAPINPGQYTDEQLREQMTAFADVLPSEGERGFGYKLPDRVKVEWLAIPADAVRVAVEASDEVDPVALYKHWRRHSARFGEPSGTDIPDEVRLDLVNELTNNKLDRIARDAVERLRFARRGLERDQGYAVLPDGWSGLAFDELALTLQQEFGIELPAYHAVGDRWLDAVDLATLDGIGTATTDKFGRAMRLPELVLASKEIAGSSTIPMQQGISGPALRGLDGSVYLYRVTDTDATRAPASIDEVRDELIADLDRIARYEKLVEAADGIREVAINEGLLSVAMLYDTPVQRSTQVTMGFPVQFPEIGVSDTAAEAIVEHAMSLPQDTAATDQPVANRTLVIPVDEALSLLVVEIAGQQPLTQERFQQYLQFGIIQANLLDEEVDRENPLGNAFSLDALAKRHRFELITRGDPQETDEADQDGNEDDAQASIK